MKHIVILTILTSLSQLILEAKAEEIKSIDFQHALYRGFFQYNKIPSGWFYQQPSYVPYYSSHLYGPYAPNNSGLSAREQYEFLYTSISEGPDVAIEQVQKMQANACQEPLPEEVSADVPADDPFLVNRFKFEDITSEPMGTDENGKACLYRYVDPPFSYRQIRNACIARNAIIDGAKTIPEKLRGCHASNCTTATFLAIIKLMQTRTNWDQMKDDFRCRPCPTKSPSSTCKGGIASWGPAYTQYIKGGGLKKLTEYLNEKYNLKAKNRIIAQDQFEDLAAEGIPKQGDIITIYRNGGGGHAAVFANYKRNDNGAITHICYWSSNSNGNGTKRLTSSDKQYEDNTPGESLGNRCEPIRKPYSNSTRHITSFSHTTGLDQKQLIYPVTRLEPIPAERITVPRVSPEQVPIIRDRPLETEDVEDKNLLQRLFRKE